jgi:hypothetical protein
MTAPPLSQKTIIRILTALVVALALLAGYYESLNYTYQRRLRVLQQRYERALELIPAAENGEESLQPASLSNPTTSTTTDK